MYTLLYPKWVTNKDLLYSTWNSAQCYVAAWMGAGFGREWIHLYVWLSPLAVHLKLLQYFLIKVFPCLFLIDIMLMQSALLHLKIDNQQDLLYSPRNSAQCYVAAWMGGEFE